MSKKIKSVLEKINNFVMESPFSPKDYIFWILRIIKFMENELPNTYKYQNIINLLNNFITENGKMACNFPDTERNIRKILADLETTIKNDSIDKFYVDLHPQVKKVSLKLFRQGDYSQAIFESVKKLNNYVKNKANITNKDLSDAMAKAFKEDDPIIKLNDLLSQSDQDEQEGFKFLFMGAMKGIRNPKAHETIKLDDSNRALMYLAFISLLFYRAEEANVKEK